MSSAETKEIVIASPIEKLYGVIVDYPRYPEFVPGIRSCKVRDAGAEKHVEYELDLGVKTIRYTLRMVEVRPRQVSWTLVKGDWMKVSNGSWELTPEGDGTRARYSVEVAISKPPLVPQAIVDKVSEELTRVSLPRTLEAFRRRAEGR
jgi:ribosome-associated toxin RatA of RatAB toxin-antitoxin module